MTFSHVLNPIKINDVEVKNRVVRTAHGTNLGGGIVGDDLIAYHLARGRGGVGLSIIEILAVHWSTPSTINVFIPGVEDGYRKMVDAVRPTGMKLFQQLWHAGHNSAPLDGSPPWSASDLPGFIVGLPAIRMTKGMIDEIVEAYATTAQRCVEWGIDGVEVHAAHGYLPAQFLSRAFNDREDDYGGSFENRFRFLKEVMTAIRATVPKGYPVGIRLAPDGIEGGVGVEETVQVAQLLETAGLIDYINISYGGYQKFAKMIGGMHEPVGYELPTSTPISRSVKLPSIVTGRFRTLEEADQVIRAGDASMVSFVRAMIADPDLVNKTIAGHPEQVRPCIACNQGCLARVLEMPYRMGCAINPGAGFEATIGDDRLVPAPLAKRVLVIGGGPAGMEAARVARLRGHDVTLMEATADLGGMVVAAAQAPTRYGLSDFTTWLEQEIYRLGVDVRLSTYVDADDVDESEWDSVIVATGASPRMDGVQNSNPGEPIKGMDQPHVFSSVDLMMGGRVLPGSTAVVIDDAGHYEGLAVADYLAQHGVTVSFVTRHVSVGPKVENAQMVEPALIRLSGKGFTSHTRSRVLSIDKDSVVVCPIYMPSTSNDTRTLSADIVVFVSLNRANRDIYESLAIRNLDVRVAGDANAARHIPTAVREGHLAGAAV